MGKTTRPCTILESLKHSCEEVKSMRKHKATKRNWKEFASKMEEEITKEGLSE